MKKSLLALLAIISSSQVSFGNIQLNETHRFFDKHASLSHTDQIYWDYTILDQKDEKILLQTYLVNNTIFSRWVDRTDWDGSIEYGVKNIGISCQKIGGVIETLEAGNYSLATCRTSRQYKRHGPNGINELVEETYWYGPVLGKIVKKLSLSQFEDQPAKATFSWTLVAIGISH